MLFHTLAENPHFKGFNIAHQTEKLSFDELAAYPQREKRYAAAMEWFSTGPGLKVTHIIKGLDWASLGAVTVVDVGGSYGSLSVALCEEFSQLSCIVQDRGEVIRGAQAKLSSSMLGRVSFMEHDFFDDQPVVAAGVYVLRWVLHDWSDTYAIKILRALIPALTKGSKILLCELVLDTPGTTSKLRERSARAMDLAMLEFHNGKERDLDDWIELLRKADPRFSWAGTTQPYGSRLSFFLVVWAGSS
ncbi:MAG: hypothetical protein Q9211_000964 [Gyalolechia sp. 1 TL-2023]